MKITRTIFITIASILIIIAYCMTFFPPAINQNNISPHVTTNDTGMQDYKTIDYFNGQFSSSEPLAMNETTRLTLEIRPEMDIDDARIIFSLPWGIDLISGELEVDLGSLQVLDNRSVSIYVKMTGKTDVRNIHASVLANSFGHLISKKYYLPSESVIISRSFATGMEDISGTVGPFVDIEDNESPPHPENISIQECCSSIWVHGTFFYQNEENGWSPVRNALVVVKDLQPGPEFQILGSTYTGNSGSFSLNVDGVDEVGGRDLYIVLLAISEHATVIDHPQPSLYYNWSSDLYPNIQGSELDIGSMYITVNSPALQAMDAVIDEHDWIYERTSWERPAVAIAWPYSDWPQTTGYYIYLPENHEYWNHNVVYHEYAHCVQWTLYGNMWPPSSITDKTHYIYSEKDSGFALMEGWAEFMQCAVDDDPDVLKGYYINEHGGNIETNDFYNCLDSGDIDGEIIEGSVASILWDIYDTGHAYDDSIDSQYAKIFSIMGSSPDDIRAFLIKWDESGYNQITAMDQICKLYGVRTDYHSTLNTPPNTPSTPNGETKGVTGTLYAYVTSASDPDSDQVKYTYDWDDGETSETTLVSSGSSKIASHSWLNPGTYYVKAKATDSNGASSGWSSTLTVTIDSENTPPNIPSTPYGETNGVTGTLYAYVTSASDPDSDQVKYTYDWGDGETSETTLVSSGSSKIASHSWLNPGTYYVKAKATDSNGASSGWSSTLTVRIATTTDLIANFTANVTYGPTPLAVQFVDTTTGNPTSWNWSLGDGGTSMEQHPIHTYTEAGTYPVTLTTTNADASNTKMKSNFITVTPSSLNPSIMWQRCLGGSLDDYAASIQETSDGGYVVAGNTESSDGDVTSNYGGNSDIWVVKLDTAGTVTWERCLGGSAADYACNVQQTSDGGYVIAGYTHSNDGDVSGNHGSSDFWVVKLDNAGTVIWQRCLGGSDSDYGRYIQQTSDGGYIITGNAASTDGDVDVSGMHGGADFWVVKLDANGAITWQCCLGGSSPDFAYNIQQTSDGGYIVAGDTQSADGDVSGSHGYYDFWVVKINDTGLLEWQCCLGGSSWDFFKSIQQTSDGGYIVAGTTFSNDGDVNGNHGNSDFWVVKLDACGTVAWQNCFGGSSCDYAWNIRQTSDDGYIVAGDALSTDGDVSYNHGYYDIWVVKINDSGLLEWQRCLGGSLGDFGRNIQQTLDGGYIIVGNTQSPDYDVSDIHGNCDLWVLKLNGTKSVASPVAGFTTNITTGPVPLYVQFTDTSTNSPTSWSWNFGDNTTSTAQNPTHTYTVAGTYTVCLSVDEGADTCKKTACIVVTPVLLGDANDDETVDQADTLRVLREVVGLTTKPSHDTDLFTKTDVHTNRMIDVGDAMFIAQYNVGLRDACFALVE